MIVEEEGFASWYSDEFADERDSARLAVEAFMTLESPLGAILSGLMGEGGGLSLDSLSLSLDNTMFLGRKRFNPPFLGFSSSRWVT